MNGMLSLDLSHKWAVIGGSTQGIGLATARALANLGANCVLVARNEQKLKAAVASLPLAKGNHHRYAVADYSSPNTLVPAIAQAMGGEKPVILVNNTGGPAGGAITGTIFSCISATPDLQPSVSPMDSALYEASRLRQNN